MSAVLLVVAGVGFGGQLVAGGPVLGPLGLVLLGIPGFVISQTVRPVPLSWAEVTLVTLGTTLIGMVLVGVVAALTPRGLDAFSVAAAELVTVALAAACLVRSSPSGARRAPVRIHVRPGSILAVGIGLALAGAGYLVAMRSAQVQQDQASVVQFWAVASATGEPQLGLRNATGTGLECSIAVSRPKLPEIDLAVGSVDNGASWTGSLPLRDATDTTRWQISLSCAGADGLAVQRRVFVDPVAAS